jgi:hypothetical protein
MKKIIKLTESDLERIVRKVSKEMNFLNEEMDSSVDMSDVGDDVHPSDIEDIKNDTEAGYCVIPETGDPKSDSILKQIANVVYNPKTTIGQLKSERQKVKQLKSQQNESIGAVTILGVTLSPVMFLAIAGIILIIITVGIIRKMKDPYGCRKKSRRLRRHNFWRKLFGKGDNTARFLTR